MKTLHINETFRPVRTFSDCKPGLCKCDDLYFIKFEVPIRGKEGGGVIDVEYNAVDITDGTLIWMADEDGACYEVASITIDDLYNIAD